MFKVYGEPAFREHETAVLRALEPGAYVLSTGGGVVTRPENWIEMRRLGPIVYLEAAPETLKARLARSMKRRPLLETDDWEGTFERILAERRPLYEQADFRFSVDTLELESGVGDLLRLLEAA
jgi:shikimate kinase